MTFFNYKQFYDAIHGIPLSSLPRYARSYISSGEPLAWLVYWIPAQLNLQKFFVFSLINSLFVVELHLLLKKYHVPSYIHFFIFSNFYFIVLLTGAERLKVSFVILLLSLLVDNLLAKSILILSTPLFHFQSLVLWTSFVSSWIFTKISSFNFKYKISLRFMFYLFCLAVPLLVSGYFLASKIISKVSGYAALYAPSFQDLIISSIFICIVLYCSREKLKTFSYVFPIIFFAFFIGTSRLNMMIFLVSFYRLMVEKIFIVVLFCYRLYFIRLNQYPFYITYSHFLTVFINHN